MKASVSGASGSEAKAGAEQNTEAKRPVEISVDEAAADFWERVKSEALK